MDLLKITTLGGVSIQLNNQPVTGFVSRKVEALLVYLAANPREHPRELLGEMLWDDLPQARTMSYLRTTLSSLQKQLAPHLVVTRQSLSINPESNYFLDSAALNNALSDAEKKWEARETLSKNIAEDLREALNHYKGSFLQGFHIRNARGFEGWMILEQERLHSRVLEALYRLGNFALERGLYSSGIEYTSRVIQMDPLWEAGHRQMMTLLMASGQRSAALAQYDSCVTVLEEELGVEPEDETIELYESIQSGELEITTQRETPNNLPTASTPFVDRPTDIQKITEQLDHSECRLLTLVGPGGIGKSRLALELGSRHLQDFPQGVFFVNFVAGSSRDVINTIANALDLRSRHDRTAEEELIQHLHDQEILLILDNFDEFLDFADTITTILNGAPYVKMIVTARERLNLQEEWLFNVDSLAIPFRNQQYTAEEVLQFPSIELFDTCARRMRVDFSIDDNLEAVTAICQLVRGIPLAIELAASWIRMMPPDQILDQVKQGFDVLSTSLRNIPERHRSMRAVFESSWTHLSQAEQDVFRRLSVFRGGFDHTAAKQVADASIFVLSGLVDKSLLTSLDGRYNIHELLRQFATEKLLENKAEFDAVQQSHADYFAEFMESRDSRLSYNLEDTTFDEVLRDIDNVWEAWDHALNNLSIPHITKFLLPLYRFLDLQSRYRDAEHAFRVATEKLFATISEDVPVKHRAKILLGTCLQHLTQFDEATSVIYESLPFIMEHGTNWDQIVAQRALGNIAYAKGHYLEARDHFNIVLEKLYKTNQIAQHATILFRLSDIETVLGNYEAAQDILERSRDIIDSNGGIANQMRHSITLGDIQIKMGSYQDAEENFKHALKLCENIEAPTTVAVILVSLGRTAIAMGNYDEAINHCLHSISICDELRNLWGKAFAQMQLGRAYYRNDAFAEAKRQFRLALDICKEINSPWIEAVTRRYRSMVNHQLGDIGAAAEDLEIAYTLALEINARPVVIDILAGLVTLLAYIEHPEPANSISAYILNEPVAEHQSLAQIQKLIDESLIHPEESSIPDDIQSVIAQGFEAIRSSVAIT